MQIELFDFQVEAADVVETNLRRAQKEVLESEGEAAQAIVLSAPTGAGKTVIMSKVIETILGGDDFRFSEEGPAVLWITDSPELNEQTRQRLSAHLDADLIVPVETVDDRFDHTELPRGVWFLNIQKLGKKGNLIRSADFRTNTFWQTVANTVERRPGDLVLVNDEAHRGMTGERERKTIIQRFITGYESGGLKVPPVPLLIGVSATPKRFDKMLSHIEPRRTERRVEIKANEVRRSGLLKQTIRLRHAHGSGTADTLLKASLDQYLQFVDGWKEHTTAQTSHRVDPVMLIQVEDAEKRSKNRNGANSRTDLHTVVQEVKQALGVRLHERGIAHAFQEDGSLNLSGIDVRKLAPSKINDDEHVQVVLFKAALNTGWDCPRAEVMMSYRSAKDDTLIAQLVGRMVRAPLRREIEESELLNGVDLYLPHFDEGALDKVVAKLNDETSEQRTATRAIVVRDLSINPTIENDIEEIRRALAEIPTYVPGTQRRKSEIGRLADVARGLERHTTKSKPVLEGASEAARDQLVNKMLELHENYDSKRLDDAAKKILTVQIGKVEARLDPDGPHMYRPSQPDTHHETEKSGRDLQRQFDDCNSKLGNGILRESLRRLHTTQRDRRRFTAELIALVEDIEVEKQLQDRARQQIVEWHKDYNEAVKDLPDDEEKKLNELFAEPGSAVRKEWSSDSVLPDVIRARKPKSDGPSFERHIYTEGTDTEVSLDLNGWESQIVIERLQDPDVVAWMRNERVSGRWRLAVPYTIGGAEGLMYPDLLLFRRHGGSLSVDIVDPHSLHLADAIDKLHGLAKYASERSEKLGRVIAVAEVDNRLCQQDLRIPDNATVALKCETETIARVFLSSGTTPQPPARHEPPEDPDRDDAPPERVRRRRRLTQ